MPHLFAQPLLAPSAALFSSCLANASVLPDMADHTDKPFAMPFSHQSSLRTGSQPLSPRVTKHRDQALWKWQLIQPALSYPKHSCARGQQLRYLAADVHALSDGRQRSVSLDSLYTWVSCYEQQGVTALMRRPRCDVGRPRVLITRAWDRACSLPADARVSVAEQLAEQVRSLWAAGAPGYRTVAELGSAVLFDLSVAAGWSEVSLADCRLSRRYVEQFRHYALLAMHDKDARLFFDTRVPRIRRHREGLKPMDILVGDVHPIDIRLTRTDGSVVMPRAIAWLDVATQRLHVTLIMLEKGEGVKQVHVAHAFAAMCSAWGLPRQLYLDNGAEYGWQEMLDGFAQLGRLTGVEIDTRLKPVVRARPYNAQAKPIEGIFAVLEQQVLSMLPGWVGGNRMRQKTHNVGQMPRAFPGDWTAFHQSFDQALDYYHARAQPRSAHLRGRSPNQALSAAIADGWTGAPQVDPQVLRVAFASEESRLVQAGGYLSVNGKHYFADELIPYAGERLCVRFVKWDANVLFVFDTQRRLICTASEAKTFAFFGKEGAHTQSERAKTLKRHLQGLRVNTVRLDLEQAMRRRTELAEPAPEMPRGPCVTLNASMRRMLQAATAEQSAQANTSLASQRASQTSSSTPSSLSVPSQWQTPPNARLLAQHNALLMHGMANKTVDEVVDEWEDEFASFASPVYLSTTAGVPVIAHPPATVFSSSTIYPQSSSAPPAPPILSPQSIQLSPSKVAPFGNRDNLGSNSNSCNSADDFDQAPTSQQMPSHPDTPWMVPGGEQ